MGSERRGEVPATRPESARPLYERAPLDHAKDKVGVGAVREVFMGWSVEHHKVGDHPRRNHTAILETKSSGTSRRC